MAAVERTYRVARLDGERGYFVMCERSDAPSWWRVVAWFDAKDRADSYAEIEQQMDIDLDQTKEEPWAADMKEKPPAVPPPPDPLPALQHQQDMDRLEIDRLTTTVKELTVTAKQTTTTVEKIADPVAQRTEREVPNLKVAGSTPAGVAKGPKADAPTASQGALTRSAKNVLTALCDLIPGESGTPSISEIKERSGEPSVPYQLEQLEKAGAIRNDGERGAPVYTILKRDVAAIVTREQWPDGRGKKMQDDQAAIDSFIATKGVTKCPPAFAAPSSAKKPE